MIPLAIPTLARTGGNAWDSPDCAGIRVLHPDAARNARLRIFGLKDRVAEWPVAVQTWARRHVVLAFLLAGFVGALVGHFYWATPPACPPPAARTFAAAAYPDCQKVDARAR